MKKIISAILVCVLLVGSIFSLASCSTIVMGTYSADLVLYEETYEFTLFGTVTKTTNPIAGDSTVVKGTYKIYEADANEYKISFTWENEEASNSVAFSTGTQDGVDFIKIAGIQYNKVK